VSIDVHDVDDDFVDWSMTVFRGHRKSEQSIEVNDLHVKCKATYRYRVEVIVL
jgi:hypothetical protein